MSASSNSGSLAELEAFLTEFCQYAEPAIREFILAKNNLRPWTPHPVLRDDKHPFLDDKTRDELRTHLESLNLPADISDPLKPNLLLHQLGEDGFYDFDRFLKNIFKTESSTMFVNTSGSGKTRLVLEGLCKYWGFYFTCQNPPSDVFSSSSQFLGSEDLTNIINFQLPGSSDFTEKLDSTEDSSELDKNCELAGFWFNILFLARLIVLCRFLAISKDLRQQQSSLNARMLRKKWLLIQISPSLLGQVIPSGTFDVFTDLVDGISRRLSPTSKDLETLLIQYFAEVSSLIHQISRLGPSVYPQFYIVIDEAQDGVHCLEKAFLSGTKTEASQQPEESQAEQETEALSKQRYFRPVLRQLIFVLAEAFVFARHARLKGSFVITGTGISRDLLLDATSSTVVKSAKFQEPVRNLPGFDLPDVQRQYISKYLAPYLSTAEGQQLTRRLWHWLCGRFRFTAEYISLIIADGLRQPTALLNLYITAFARINVTDYPKLLESEPHVLENENMSMPFQPLDFRRLKEQPLYLKKIRKACYTYFTRSITVPLGTDEEIFIETGFARYKYNATRHAGTTAIIEEPLVLLAAAADMNTNSEESLHTFFTDDLGYNSPGTIEHRNFFEDFLATYFLECFHEPRSLTSVFEFQNPHEMLTQCQGTLVSLFKNDLVGQHPILEPSRIHFSTNSTVELPGCLGEDAEGHDTVNSWLQHQKHSTILFPSKDMGPDLIFILDITKEKQHIDYIWVAVQAKYYTDAEYMSKGDFADAVRSVTPQRFFMQSNDVESASLEQRLDDIVNETRQKYAGTQNNKHLLRRDNTLAILDKLSNGNKLLAGRHNLLRVVACFPQKAEFSDPASLIHDFVDIYDEDAQGNRHPLAVLNRRLLITLQERKHPTDILARINQYVLERVESLRTGMHKAQKNVKDPERVGPAQPFLDKLEDLRREYPWIPRRSHITRDCGKLKAFLHLCKTKYYDVSDEVPEDEAIDRRHEAIDEYLRGQFEDQKAKLKHMASRGVYERVANNIQSLDEEREKRRKQEGEGLELERSAKRARHSETSPIPESSKKRSSGKRRR